MQATMVASKKAKSATKGSKFFGYKVLAPAKSGLLMGVVFVVGFAIMYALVSVLTDNFLGGLLLASPPPVDKKEEDEEEKEDEKQD